MLNPIEWLQIRAVERCPVFLLTQFRPFLEFPDDGLHDTVHGIVLFMRYTLTHIFIRINYMTEYVRWNNIAETIAENRLTDWKTHPDVNYMLEHEWESAAKIYIEYLTPFLTAEQIQAMALTNDTHGVPEIKTISGIRTSPSSIRYIRHSYDVCSHSLSKGLQDVTIIEIGGGYGGLALTMFQMANILNLRIKNYIIYDIPGVRKLQQYYLSLHGIDSKVSWKDADTYGSECNSEDTNVLVSCYCISEIPSEYRARYLRNLLPKIKAAFFVWNWGSKEDLPEDRDERPEIPDTSGGNGNTVIRL